MKIVYYTLMTLLHFYFFYVCAKDENEKYLFRIYVIAHSEIYAIEMKIKDNNIFLCFKSPGK